MTIAGLVVGWRIHTDVFHALAGFGLLVLVAFAMLWVGMLLGRSCARPTRSQGIVFIVIFPLTFVGQRLRPGRHAARASCSTFADWNPVSALVAAMRTLFGNPTAVAGRRRVAAPAPGRQRAAVVRGAAGGRRAAGHRGLSPAHRGLAGAGV